MIYNQSISSTCFGGKIILEVGTGGGSSLAKFAPASMSHVMASGTGMVGGPLDMPHEGSLHERGPCPRLVQVGCHAYMHQPVRRVILTAWHAGIRHCST